jgi:hypothetical protein
MAEIAIKLGGKSYTVPQYSVDQFLRSQEFIFEEGQIEAIGLLRIATERAKPTLLSFNNIPFDVEEFTIAAKAVARFAGLTKGRSETPVSRREAKQEIL